MSVFNLYTPTNDMLSDYVQISDLESCFFSCLFQNVLWVIQSDVDDNYFDLCPSVKKKHLDDWFRHNYIMLPYLMLRCGLLSCTAGFFIRRSLMPS